VSAALQGQVASVLLVLGVVGLAGALCREPGLRALLARHRAQLDRDLRYLQMRTSAERVILTQLAALLGVAAIALLRGSLGPLSLTAAILVGPRAWLRRLCRLRTARVEEQLDTWLLALANALKANPSLGDSIASSAGLMAAPLREELELLLREGQIGVALDRGLRNLTERVGSPVVSAAVATLRIARRAGGNLGQTLESCAASLREMARLEGVVRTKTAEGRAQSLLIGVIPAPLIWMLQSLNPELLSPLWSTTRGHAVLVAAAMLWACALICARKILAVDV
jgi:tight adherence protein B